MSTATLDAGIGKAEGVLLDTSTLIAFHSSKEPAHDLAKHLFNRIQRDDDSLTGHYSVISATELLVRPIRVGPSEFAFMHTFLRNYPHLRVLPVDLDVATEAATLRAIKNLKTPDAIIIASGLLSGCEVIVTNDEEWKRKMEPLFREFRWIYLSEHVGG
jgi:predicted nucleic acid-binding protein